MNIYDEIVAASTEFGSRNSDAIFRAIVEEVGELSTELNIRSGFKQREHGPDGVIGEAIDILLCTLDFLNTEADVHSEEFTQRVQEKINKWQSKAVK